MTTTCGGYPEDQAFTDLQSYIKEDKLDLDQYAIEVFNFPKQPNGQHTAWVVGYELRLTCYNVDAFNEAGARMPRTEWTRENWTWDDFLSTAKKLEGPAWSTATWTSKMTHLSSTWST